MGSKKYRSAYSEQLAYDKIATQIFLLRKDRGLSQKELGRQVGMRQSRISKLEDPNNQQLSVSTLQRIAAALDVSLDVEFERFSKTARNSLRVNQHMLTPCPFDEDTIELLGVVPVDLNFDYIVEQCEVNQDVELIDDDNIYHYDPESLNRLRTAEAQ